MKKENVIEALIVTIFGVLTIGGAVVLGAKEREINQKKLDHLSSSKWWRNPMGSVIVKVLKIYPKSDKVVYTKYSTTGRNLGTCQMDFDRFLSTYGHSEKTYNY